MKLILHINRQQLWVVFLIFLLGGFVTYRVFKQEVVKETDYSLGSDLRQVQHLLEQGLPYEKIANANLLIRPIAPDSTRWQERLFTDTLAYHGPTEDQEWKRKLTAVITAHDEWYEVEMVDVIFEDQDVIETVITSLLLIFGGLLVAMLLSNFWMSQRLLRPFHQALKRLRNFELSQGLTEPLPRETIAEFDELNQTLNRLLRSSAREYRTLKEFSENASHELQTPLAILRGKLDLLIQSPQLQQEELTLVQAMYEATTRLSRLSQALVQLARIENEEYQQTEPLPMAQVLHRHLSAMSELLELKQVNVEAKLQPWVLEAHPVLTDMLIGNLLQNAIRHNRPGGEIQITLQDGLLAIANTGKPEALDPDRMFRRFAPGRQAGSLGLGLSIVKKICDGQRYHLSYHFDAGWHQFRVQFVDAPRR